MKTYSEAIKALAYLCQGPFISQQQAATVRSGFRCEEKQFFFDKICELAETVRTMPKTYEQDGKGEDAVIHLHYFTAGGDWHITEKDSESEQLQAFGLANLGFGEEFGYISLVETLACGAELDFHWQPKTIARMRETPKGREQFSLPMGGQSEAA